MVRGTVRGKPPLGVSSLTQGLRTAHAHQLAGWSPSLLSSLRCPLWKASPGLNCCPPHRCSVALASTELGIQALAEHLCVLVSMRWLRQWGLCWGTGVQGSPAVQTPRPQQLYLPDGVCIRLHSRSPTEPQSLGMKVQPSYGPLGQQRARSPPSFSQESLPRVAPQAGAHSVRPSHTHLPRVVPSPLPALPLVHSDHFQLFSVLRLSIPLCLHPLPRPSFPTSRPGRGRSGSTHGLSSRKPVSAPILEALAPFLDCVVFGYLCLCLFGRLRQGFFV